MWHFNWVTLNFCHIVLCLFCLQLNFNENQLWFLSSWVFVHIQWVFPTSCHLMVFPFTWGTSRDTVIVIFGIKIIFWTVFLDMSCHTHSKHFCLLLAVSRVLDCNFYLVASFPRILILYISLHTLIMMSKFDFLLCNSV